MEFSKLIPDPHAPYQEMYVTLFKAVTAALCMMGDGEIMKARAILARLSRRRRTYILRRTKMGEAPAIGAV